MMMDTTMEIALMPAPWLILTMILLLPTTLAALAPAAAEEKIQQLLEKSVRRNRHVHLGLLLVHSDKLGIHWKYAAGEAEDVDARYHIASIGKIFTSTLVSQLAEEGKLGFDTPIVTILPEPMLKDLFVYRGTDHRDRVLVRHLLNHTSGAADWFEDQPKDGPSFLEQALAEPRRTWTPDDVLEFARKHLKAVAPPGVKFHYSDTGYHLLGKCIEQVTGDSLHVVLHERIFDPLDMRASQMWLYSEPANADAPGMLPIWMGEVEISSHKWVKADWAGGGVVTSAEDLLKYMKALVNHELVGKGTLAAWQDWARFGYGMDYGYGILQLNFHKFSPFLSKDLKVWGNWGSISTFMFYNRKHDVYMIGAFNQSKYIRRTVVFLMRVMQAIERITR